MSGSVQDRIKRFPDVDFNVNIKQMEKLIEAATHASDREIKDLAKEIKQARIDRDAIPHVTFPAWGSDPPAGRLFAERIAPVDGVAPSQGRVRLAATSGTIRAFGAWSTTTASDHRRSTLALVASRIARTLVEWRARAVQRRILATLDDYILSDIGLSRADVEREVSKPFWHR